MPLPALAASMIVPDDMGEPTDDVLEQVSEAMMRLDDQFRLLEPIGLVEYQPVDEALMARGGRATPSPRPPVDDEDVSRYGMVRLTPLGLYGVRARMLEAGRRRARGRRPRGQGRRRAARRHSPRYPEAAAQAETEQWLARREPARRRARAARRGARRRRRARRCAGCAASRRSPWSAPEAEPALREVLDDPELGGLARVWLAERGAAGRARAVRGRWSSG